MKNAITPSQLKEKLTADFGASFKVSNRKNTCLQGRMKLSIRVIFYSHGNNSWFLIFCEVFASWLCVGGKGGSCCFGGFGGYFCNEHLFLHQPGAKEDLQRMAKKIFD